MNASIKRSAFLKRAVWGALAGVLCTGCSVFSAREQWATRHLAYTESEVSLPPLSFPEETWQSWPYDSTYDIPELSAPPPSVLPTEEPPASL